MTLASGRLRSRVTIRRLTIGDDGHGGPTRTWNTLATVAAEVISQNGREAVIAGALQGVSAYRVTIRWRADPPRAADQLRLDDGTDLNIRTCDDTDRRREQLVIFADTASAEA